MKMGHSLFWGLLLVILGLSLIIKIVFNVDFPLFRIFISFVLIYFGIRLLFGNSFPKVHLSSEGEKEVLFSEKNFSNFDQNSEYSTVFGKSTYDFRGFDMKGDKRRIRVSTVFGATIIKLDRDLPVRIKIESVFSGVDLPDRSSAVLGTTSYESPSFDPEKPYLDLKMEVIFAGAEVKIY